MSGKSSSEGSTAFTFNEQLSTFNKQQRRKSRFRRIAANKIRGFAISYCSRPSGMVHYTCLSVDIFC